MSEHPNIALIHGAFAAFASGDMSSIADYWADDAVWNSAGENWLVGTYRGIEAIMAVFGTVAAYSENSFTSKLHYAIADDKRVISFQKITANRSDGRSMDMDSIMVVDIEDGKIKEGWMCPWDFYHEDAYYGLTPPPGFSSPPKAASRTTPHFWRDDRA